jgi:DNA mismatch repair protein MutS
MANATRYSTTELAELESQIASAGERALTLELELFEQLCRAVLAEADAIAASAQALARLDVAAGLAELAVEQRYCRPEVDDSDAFAIEAGRHPVVERALADSGERFVANDLVLGRNDRLWLITGPNMGGKSTFLRQAALVAVLAQAGSFVPAARAKVGIVDRLFSRVGASDNLARGRSTFMVEMVETAAILAQATPSSLVILDEIGRGTSTYDGLSIAWAVVEHLHRDAERGPRTLFATHYQELTQLEKHLPRLRNFSVAVKEWNDEIVFVRRVVPGAADRSYGIQVARLAGLPPTVIDRAKVILSKLESEDSTNVELPAPQARPKKKIAVKPADDAQLSLL